MTLEQLFEIFFQLHNFHVSIASCVLLRGHDYLFVTSGSGKAQKTSKKITGTLFTVASNRSKLQANDFRKLHQKHPQGFLMEKKFPVEFLFRNMPSDGQIHRNLHRDGCYFVLVPSPIFPLTRNRASGGRF